jgi:hypothetical protein
MGGIKEEARVVLKAVFKWEGLKMALRAEVLADLGDDLSATDVGGKGAVCSVEPNRDKV